MILNYDTREIVGDNYNDIKENSMAIIITKDQMHNTELT